MREYSALLVRASAKGAPTLFYLPATVLITYSGSSMNHSAPLPQGQRCAYVGGVQTFRNPKTIRFRLMANFGASCPHKTPKCECSPRTCTGYYPWPWWARGGMLIALVSVALSGPFTGP